MNLGIVEDTSFSQFLPVAYFRPVFHLRCGLYSLEERIRKQFPAASVSLHVRPYLADYLREVDPKTPVNEIPEGDTLFVNGRVLADSSFASVITKHKKQNTVYTSNGAFAAAYLTGATVQKLSGKLKDRMFELSLFSGIPTVDISGPMINYPWDLVHQNAEMLEEDALDLPVSKSKSFSGATIHPGAHIINRPNIWIGKGSVIKPGAVLDAEHGPIIIGQNITVLSNAVIEGPTFIGDSSVIKIGAKICHSNIGAWCKMGGEVEASIVQSHSNKQHEGFLGHAYVGCWANLGADTNNSDLKNNYGTVKVILNGKSIDTGLLFVGLIMGDHSKTGINTMFDTGSVMGVSCNVFDSGLPPKAIPSFTWGSANAMTSYDLEKSIATAKVVMARRDVPFTPAYEQLFRTIHELAKDEAGSLIEPRTRRTVH